MRWLATVVVALLLGVTVAAHADDRYTIVVYGLPDNAPYDTRLFERMVPAMERTFPQSQYPRMRDVRDAYSTLTVDPTPAHGKALEALINTFAEGFAAADEAKFQEMYFGIVQQEMINVRVRYARETTEELYRRFPARNHPNLQAVGMTAQAFESNPNDENNAAFEEAVEAFEANLGPTDRAEAEAIQETVSDRVLAGDPADTEKIWIDGVVANFEEQKDWLNSEPGDYISASAFDGLGENMSYTQVEGVMGREGRQTGTVNTTINGQTTTTVEYEWSWPMGTSANARVRAWFLNGQLRVKCYNEIAG